MFKEIKFILVVCFFLSGCARIIDIPKVIWGSSTRALEEARVDAISKTYRCTLSDCYDAVLDLAVSREKYAEKIADQEFRSKEVDYGNTRGQEIQHAEGRDHDVDQIETPEIIQKNYFQIFINNRKKGYIVVMGIPGNVDTTEVGIFFSQQTLTTVKLEVSSLSSSAKRTVAEKAFKQLDLRFSPAE